MDFRSARTRKQFAQTHAELVQRALKRKIKELNISDSGDFLDSIKISWKDYFTPVVGSDLVYAHNIEEGRLAGTHVPIEPLVKWVRHKKHPGIDEKEATKIAYAIENKIYREGIKGRHVMRLVLEDIEAGRVID